MIKTLIKNLWWRLFPQHALNRKAYARLIQRQSSYLHVSGWMETLRTRRPVDEDGETVPWMNYPVIHFLKNRLNSTLCLFEYGSGNSTEFFAKRVSSVTSVEHDQLWFNRVAEWVPDNATVLFRTEDVDGQYCRAILETGKSFDVVVVDGRDRDNCLLHAVKALTPRGVIVLDDSQRPEYVAAIKLMTDAGFEELQFQGLKPLGTGSDRTSIFYRHKNCLNI